MKEKRKIIARIKKINEYQYKLYRRFDNMQDMTPAKVRSTNIKLDELAIEERELQKKLAKV